jgi:hypothetical protein
MDGGLGDNHEENKRKRLKNEIRTDEMMKFGGTDERMNNEMNIEGARQNINFVDDSVSPGPSPRRDRSLDRRRNDRNLDISPRDAKSDLADMSDHSRLSVSSEEMKTLIADKGAADRREDRILKSRKASKESVMSKKSSKRSQGKGSDWKGSDRKSEGQHNQSMNNDTSDGIPGIGAVDAVGDDALSPSRQGFLRESGGHNAPPDSPANVNENENEVLKNETDENENIRSLHAAHAAVAPKGGNASKSSLSESKSSRSIPVGSSSGSGREDSTNAQTLGASAVSGNNFNDVELPNWLAQEEDWLRGAWIDVWLKREKIEEKHWHLSIRAAKSHHEDMLMSTYQDSHRYHSHRHHARTSVEGVNRGKVQVKPAASTADP